MSVITDVVLCAHDTDSAAVQQVSDHLKAGNFHTGGDLLLVGPSTAFGGGKVACTAVWGASFNYLDWEELLDAVGAASWQYPEHVAVIRWHEHAGIPETWTLCGIGSTEEVIHAVIFEGDEDFVSRAVSRRRPPPSPVSQTGDGEEEED